MFTGKMKRSILALFFCCFMLSGFQVLAQKAGPEATSKAMTDRMKAQLNLTDEQYSKAAQINLDFSKGIAEARHSGAERQEQFSKMRELRQKREASLKMVLNEEQFKQFKEQQQENRKALRDRNNAATE